MIFVTVGTDAPFDRLVRAVDSWAAGSGRDDVFAQIGVGGWRPPHLEWREMLEPPEFMERFRAASLVVAHAGMGTILTALRHGKPILVMPKKAALGEHRNEHQTATARHLRELQRVEVAFDEHELLAKLGQVERLAGGEPIGSYAQPQLIEGLRGFIQGRPPSGGA